MITDPHCLQFPVLCLIWKSTPNILWSVGGVANNELLQVRKEGLALMARVSVMSLFADYKRLRLSKRLAKGLGGVGRLSYWTTD